MKAHLIDTHLLGPRSRSSAKVKVKYKGHVSQKMGVSGALVFHKHILLILGFCGCGHFLLFPQRFHKPSSRVFLCPRIERSWAYCSTVVRLSLRPSVCLHKLNMKTEHFPITPKLV